VEGGRYFVTVRCHDSLPEEIVARLSEIHTALRAVASHSAGFIALQRQYFLTMEKYLDAGHGHPWLASSAAAEIIADELCSLCNRDVDVPHYTIMPNHWHALLVPTSDCVPSLSRIMRTIKGRSARRINAALGRTGTLWQREWFDRWMRDDAEWSRCVAYIRQNPVKAGLVHTWPEHPWTQ